MICGPGVAFAEQAPLSAIDWLASPPVAQTSPLANTPPTAEPRPTGAQVPEISVTSLEMVNADSVGLLPPSSTGLPVSIWRNSQTADIIELLNNLPKTSNSAIQSVIYSLLLAEADAPQSTPSAGAFLAKRIETLVKLGAVYPAMALLERASPLPASLVPVVFDVSLYDSSLAPSCDQVLGLGASYPDDATRIYCLARKGDWLTASLILQTAQALDSLTPHQAALLHEFLQTDVQDGLITSMPPPAQVTPLEFRLYEAIGAPLSTNMLPRAFANSDLNGDNGWKSQLTAAERLAETGAIGDNQLLGLYTQNVPSASGGIWDRVEVFQKLDRALDAGVAEEIASALDRAWDAFDGTPLRETFANIFADRLLGAPLTGADRILAARISVLSPQYERAAQNLGGQDQFLQAIAQGDLENLTPTGAIDRAIQDAFIAPRIPMSIDRLVNQGKLGEVILNALIQFDQGAQGDPQDLLESLSTLRLIGLENTARRAAISVYLGQDR